MRNENAKGEDEELDARSEVTPEELAELTAALRPARTAAEVRPQAGSDRAALIEDALKYWEQIVRELRGELRELRVRIEQLECRQPAEQPSAPRLATPLARADSEAGGSPESGESLSRVKRHQNAKRRWF